MPLSSASRGRVALCAGLAIAGVLLTSALAQGRRGGGGAEAGGRRGGQGGGASLAVEPVAPATPVQRALAFASRGAEWAWLSSREGSVALSTGGPGKQPREIASGEGWSDVALDEGSVWVVDNRTRRILRIARQEGAIPETVVSLRGEAGGLLSAEGRLFWLERLPAPRADLLFVPAAGPMLRLMSWSGGQSQPLGEWPASPGAHAVPGPGDIIAAGGDTVFTRIRRLTSTELVRFGPKEAAVRLGVEAGWQQGALFNGKLHWTAPSAEAPSYSIMQVKRETPSGGESLTDWLPRGELGVAKGKLWAVGRYVYQVPDRPGPAALTRGSFFQPRMTEDGSIVELTGPAPRVVEGSP